MNQKEAEEREMDRDKVRETKTESTYKRRLRAEDASGALNKPLSPELESYRQRA